TQVSEVNNLVDRFFEARKMMTAMASGKMPGMPGLPGMGGGQKKQQPKAKKKNARGVSGNPAKRNQQPAPAAVDPAAAFGVPQNMDPAELQKALGDFQLPPELTKRLGK
ncbi:MAG TPA: signal recognition particle protein, partial [Microlunatus sp.]|nr:signal recognition particle protein [Microlunatus sp.]